MPDRIVDVDVERLVRQWAVADPDVRAIYGTDPTRIATKLDPTKSAVLPASRLTRIATPDAVPDHLTAPVLEVDTWAPNDTAAFDAAKTLRARMHERSIIGVHAGIGVITGYDTAQGLRLLDDPDAENLVRYIFSTRYYCHPLTE